MLTLLTTTGERQRAWDLCQIWMARQTYSGPVRWVIVDDGKQQQQTTFSRKHWELVFVRPEPFWDGSNTQARNLQAGLAQIGGIEWVVIIEDDDYYAPQWLETIFGQFKNAELIGERRARYYNVQTNIWRRMENMTHASLCSTAMRSNALTLFRDIATTEYKFIDIVLWEKAKSRHLFDSQLTVGIKGLPGRAGIGSGHDRHFYGEFDRDGSKLREWLGADSQYYMNDKDGKNATQADRTRRPIR